MEKKYIIIVLFVYSLRIFSAEIDWKGPKFRVLDRYYKIHRNFSKKLCPGGTEPKFNSLMKMYRGNGQYVPVDIDGELEKEVVKKYLPEIKNKITWIDAQILNLKSRSDIYEIKGYVAKLRTLLNILLKNKQIYHESNNEKERLNARNNSISFYSDFKNRFSILVSKTPFLLGYNFPVDHLSLRRDYDTHRKIKDSKNQSKANDIYFFRKIVEDGAADPNHNRNDIYFRTTLNTIFHNLSKKADFISEDLRFDITYALKNYDNYLSKGRSYIIRRLVEWKGRTHRRYLFYKSLMDDKVSFDDSMVTSKEIIALKSKAKFNLVNYVLSKYSKVFEFWSQQDELMRSLYVIETILFNEVGRIDGRDALERSDVTQVVINRSRLKEFSTLNREGRLYKNLYLNTIKKVDSYKWMNTLFKEGEFSFTYFYMPGSVRVYCPDMTRAGRFLRNENLKIALKLLKNPKDDFRGLRYFSRAAMLGRIDMTTLWSDYTPIPEGPGRHVKQSLNLKKSFKNNKYLFLYYFEDSFTNKYRVVEIDEKNYVMTLKNMFFFKQRMPHYFKFFKKKDI